MTYREAFNKLPEPYNEMAIEERLQQYDNDERSLDRKVIVGNPLSSGFTWNWTEIGHNFWDGVNDNAITEKIWK